MVGAGFERAGACDFEYVELDFTESCEDAGTDELNGCPDVDEVVVTAGPLVEAGA